MPKDIELSNISNILLRYYTGLFCFNESDNDVIFALKCKSILFPVRLIRVNV